MFATVFRQLSGQVQKQTIFRNTIKYSWHNVTTSSVQVISKSFGVSTRNNKMTETQTETTYIDKLVRQLAPSLDSSKHKGQAGRIGVVGGSLEYTGAPYFAAISALKLGADIVHVFCAREAATVIKSYSPELIVHPILDAADAPTDIIPWLDRLHTLIIGPGLGREPRTLAIVKQLITTCGDLGKPLVIDADGLFLLSELRTTDPTSQLFAQFARSATPVILTPNVAEYARLLNHNSAASDPKSVFTAWGGDGNNVTVLVKGLCDEVRRLTGDSVAVSGGGSGRRCGGQGDLLAGTLGVCLAWAQLKKGGGGGGKKVPWETVACVGACRLVRGCNARGFGRLGRSMTASDMIQEIHPMFEELFEAK